MKRVQLKEDAFFGQQARFVLGVFSFLLLMLAGCGSSSSGPGPKPTPTATGTATPVATPTADVILFSPTSTQLTTGTSSQFTINLTALDSTGAQMTPSNTSPMYVNVYGAGAGVITPATSTLTTSSSVTFTYNGGAVPNNVLIDAWIADPTIEGYAIGQTMVLPQNATCAAGTQNHSVPLQTTLPKALTIEAAVGYTNPSGISSPVPTYTVDTRSLGTIAPQSEIETAQNDTVNGFVIGPGPQGTTCYDSSGNAYWGNYYLAPVDIQTSNGWVQTSPIMVLAVKYTCQLSSCDNVPSTPPCSNPASLHYIGVGYDRESTTPGNLFQSPAQNAFLHVTDANNGIDIAPGYLLSTGGVTLGVNSTSSYGTYSLTPDSAHPGDFQLIPGSFGFPDLSSHFSGRGIFDVGIDEMLLKLPMSQWPSGTSRRVPASTCASGYQVSKNTAISVTLGNPSSPVVSYSFTTGGTASGSDPNNVCWQDTTNTPLAGTPIVNTGRNPLDCYNYLYNGQCGVVGFQPILPAPAGCP